MDIKDKITSLDVGFVQEDLRKSGQLQVYTAVKWKSKDLEISVFRFANNLNARQ